MTKTSTIVLSPKRANPEYANYDTVAQNLGWIICLEF
jgi:hypothetical protein